MSSSISYLLGNFLGRVLVSYLLVWGVLFLFSRLNWRMAFARSRRWPGILAVLVLALLGMGSAFSRSAAGSGL
ncbi:hypothetical protein ACFO3A_15550 [Comamonas nitrativorans]|uniref:Uncharacterized protein n=1 Tax=Comamonas nitrativorans TaxID=108437 RepID=A0ABV9H389_9BURK